MNRIDLSQIRPEKFARYFETARRARSRIDDACSAFEHVNGTRYFASPEGRSGFAVRPDGELVFVFSTVPGRGFLLVAAAVARGANHLDCFDGYLVDLYQRAGFDKVTSLPNWTAGGPDVVFMALPNHFLKALDKAENAV